MFFLTFYATMNSLHKAGIEDFLLEHFNFHHE